MLKLLAFLWTGCWHRWSVTEKRPYRINDADGEMRRRGTLYLLRCERCGGLKTFRSMGS
jgi:hypothetical protein